MLGGEPQGRTRLTSGERRPRSPDAQAQGRSPVLRAIRHSRRGLGAPPRTCLRFEPSGGAGERGEPADGAQVSPNRAAVLGPGEQGLIRRSGGRTARASATVPPGWLEALAAEVAVDIGTRRGRPGGHRSGRRSGSDFSAAKRYARQYARTMGRRGTMHPFRHLENRGKLLILLLVPHWSRIHISR